MNPKVAFLVIGHKDYQYNLGLKFAKDAVKRLRENGIDIVFYGKSLNEMIDAQNEAKKIIREDIDGVIIFLGTWVECSTAMAAVRMIEYLPFLIWGFYN